MSVDAIKEAIAALPPEERQALVSWLNELEYDAWDKQMVRDFSPGGRGMALVERVKREITDGKTASLQEGRALAEVILDHRTTASFWDCYNTLSEDLRDRADIRSSE